MCVCVLGSLRFSHYFMKSTKSLEKTKKHTPTDAGAMSLVVLVCFVVVFACFGGVPKKHPHMRCTSETKIPEGAPFGPPVAQ